MTDELRATMIDKLKHLRAITPVNTYYYQTGKYRKINMDTGVTDRDVINNWIEFLEAGNNPHSNSDMKEILLNFNNVYNAVKDV